MSWARSQGGRAANQCELPLGWNGLLPLIANLVKKLTIFEVSSTVECDGFCGVETSGSRTMLTGLFFEPSFGADGSLARRRSSLVGASVGCAFLPA